MSNARIQRAGTTEVSASKLPIIGSIKVGEKVKTAAGKEYPKSLDYFRATGDYAPKFHEAFGDKPTSIGIIFMSDDINSVCNERYELRDTKTGSLIGKGDGKNFDVWNPKLADNKGAYESVVVESELDKAKFGAECKKLSNNGTWMAILTINFIIPKIGSVMGYWKFESKGVKSSIPNIRDAFDMVKEFAGTCVNIPFDLQVKKVKSQRPGDARLYPVVALIPNVSKDKLDDVRQFLSQGNKIAELKRFLMDEPLAIAETTEPTKEGNPNVIVLKEGKPNVIVLKESIAGEVQANLFDN
jgi:hypothetical protein